MVFWSDSKEILLPHHMTQLPFFPESSHISLKSARVPTHCLPLAWPRHSLHDKCKCFICESLFLLGAAAHGRQLVLSRYKRDSGSERATARLWIRHFVRGPSRGDLWSFASLRTDPSSLASLPFQTQLLKLFNRETRVYDYHRCAFRSPVLLCLNGHSASFLCLTGWMGFLKRIQ